MNVIPIVASIGEIFVALLVVGVIVIVCGVIVVKLLAARLIYKKVTNTAKVLAEMATHFCRVLLRTR